MQAGRRWRTWFEHFSAALPRKQQPPSSSCPIGSSHGRNWSSYPTWSARPCAKGDNQMNPNLVSLLAKVALLLVLAWVLSIALRRQSASLRSLVWTLALGGILALPLLSKVAPPLRVGILPSRELPLSP